MNPKDPADPTPPRRAFLRRLTSGAAALAVPPWLAACGGGGSDAPTEPGPGAPATGGPLGENARAVAIAGVEDHCRTLAQQPGLTPLAFVEAVAARLRTDPAYAAAGVDAATLCAWGVFTDGRVHVIANNYRPQRSSTPAGAALPQRQALAAAVNELPGAASARVMQCFGPLFDGADVVTDLAAWLQEKGWQLPRGAEQQAQLATLRGLQGAGCFYINTHGGAFQPTLFPGSGQLMYSIQSSTLVSPAQEALPETVADMAARRLTYFTATNGDLILGQFPDWDTRYGITSAFVDAYWKFAADSVVILNACSSARTDTSAWSAGFVLACHQAGAAVVLGWNNTVTPLGAFRAARYFIDRLLGANRFQPETPAQRPFAWDAVLADMQKKSLHIDPGEGAVFTALASPAVTTRQLLAPSIRHVEVSEYADELRLVGRFGSTPGEVTVDGRRLTVKTWAPERVVVELPRSGTGSRGPVQVTVRGVKSNLRQLTEWTLALDYTYRLLESQGLTIEGTGHVRLRADVGPTRDAPGETPAQALRYAYDTRDSQWPMVARGELPTPACTLVWTGQTTYRAIPDPGQRQILTAYLKADPAARKGWLGLGLGSPSPNFAQSGCGTTTGIEPGFGTLDAPVSYPSPLDGSSDMIPLHSLALDFDAQYGILAGRSETVLARLVWPAASAASPPLPTDGA